MQRGEAKIEKGVRKDLEAWFKEIGVKHVFLKLNVLGFNGWPDRLLLWEGGHILFIEYKDGEGADFQPLQPYVHSVIAQLGFDIEVHYDRAKSVESIKGKVNATLLASKGHDADSAQSGVTVVLTSREGKNCDCLKGFYNLESSGLRRCVTCHCPLAGSYDIVAEPTGKMGRFRRFKLRYYPWGQD